MNRNKAQAAINEIVNEYRDRAYKGGRNQYPASKKYIKQAEELGILDMIPNAPYSQHIGNQEIQEILKAANDSGHEVSGMIDGEGDVISTSASDLYKAINEQPAPQPVVVTFEVRTNTNINHVWQLKRNQDDVLSVAHTTGPADVTVHVQPGDYVQIVREQNPTHGDITETVVPVTITDEGKIIYHAAPGSLSLDELI